MMTTQDPSYLRGAMSPHPLTESRDGTCSFAGDRSAMVTDEIRLNLETSYPDEVIEVGKINFGEKERNEMQNYKRKIQNQRIMRAACALLNSGGGVIIAQIGNRNKYAYVEHGLGLDIEQSQRDLVQTADLQKYFEILHQNKLLLIFVKSWAAEIPLLGNPAKPHICSLSTNLFRRSSTSIIELNPSNALEFLKQKQLNVRDDKANEPLAKKSLLCDQEGIIHAFPARLFEVDQIKFKQTLSFGESLHVEFKLFPTKNRLKRFKETLPRYISAFANTQGGYMIYGVEDKSREVIGVSNEIVCHDTLKQEIDRAVQKLHLLHFCSSGGGITWQLKTIPVCDGDHHRSHLWIIKVAPFCCAVFLDSPDSWIVHGRCVMQLEPKDWSDKMMAADPGSPSLADHFNTALSISGAPPMARPVYTKKGLEDLADLKEYLFGGGTNEIIVYPDNLYREVSNEHPTIRKLLEEMPRSRGVLMFSRSWAVDIGIPENKHVVCDALLIAFNDYPTLYTIYHNPNDVFNNVEEYSRFVAYNLKQKIVNVGGYTGKVCVMSKLFNLSRVSNCLNVEGIDQDLDCDETLKVEYPNAYRITSTQTMNDLQKALVIVLLNFRSLLSEQLGCELFNLLTIKQYEILSRNIRKSRLLFIHGLPGTGKTVMAMKIIEKIRNVYNCGREQILYICENQPLRKYLHLKNICLAVTRTTFVKGAFPSVQHIVVDEAQNFRRDESDWFAKAKELCSKPQNPSGPGVLWIFLDYFQKCHPFENGLPMLNEQYSMEWLTKGVRNATRIYSVMMDKMVDIVGETSGGSPALHEHLKSLLIEADCAHEIPGFYDEKHLNRDEMARYVAKACYYYLRKGYSMKDIAILCNTENDITANRHILQVQMRKLRLELSFIRADDSQGQGIVLDSVRRFSGLEKNIVFGIHPVPVQREVASNILLCMASRANMRLHIIYLNSP
ncbi:schlafen family member 13-like isoform X1 [Pleurodeles waltl]|uniref:schlafen family member 13-like isoform X1 n=1 Tax=Pleurodeles waltl TaxID=8319 RepID=UPI003709C5CE